MIEPIFVTVSSRFWPEGRSTEGDSAEESSPVSRFRMVASVVGLGLLAALDTHETNSWLRMHSTTGLRSEIHAFCDYTS
jgi:hypothetical protein